jgi:hypothetical protein
MNHSLHHVAFANVWAILRQPCTAWVARRVAIHLQPYGRKMGIEGIRTEAGNCQPKIFQRRKCIGIR